MSRLWKHLDNLLALGPDQPASLHSITEKSLPLDGKDMSSIREHSIKSSTISLAVKLGLPWSPAENPHDRNSRSSDIVTMIRGDREDPMSSKASYRNRKPSVSDLLLYCQPILGFGMGYGMERERVRGDSLTSEESVDEIASIRPTQYSAEGSLKEADINRKRIEDLEELVFKLQEENRLLKKQSESFLINS